MPEMTPRVTPPCTALCWLHTLLLTASLSNARPRAPAVQLPRFGTTSPFSRLVLVLAPRPYSRVPTPLLLFVPVLALCYLLAPRPLSPRSTLLQAAPHSTVRALQLSLPAPYSHHIRTRFRAAFASAVSLAHTRNRPATTRMLYLYRCCVLHTGCTWMLCAPHRIQIVSVCSA